MKKRNKRKKSMIPPKEPMSFKKALRLSFIAHFLFFWIALGMPIGCSGGCGGKGAADKQSQEEKEKGKKSGHPDDAQEIKEKDGPIEVEIVDTPVQKSEEQIAYEKAKKKQEECKPYFGGIGVVHNQNGIIQKVYKYYPAWEAGLKEGDLIEDVYRIRGEVGTKVTINYYRDGIRHEVTITRGRICLEDARAPENNPPMQRNPYGCPVY